MDIPGAIYNILPFYGVHLADTGNYRCMIFNDCDVDTTLEAKLMVIPPSGINENRKPVSIVVFPNPVQDYFTIKADISTNFDQYCIYDELGNMKLTGKLRGKNNFKVEAAQLSPGIYFIKLLENGNNRYSKFIKR